MWPILITLTCLMECVCENCLVPDSRPSHDNPPSSMCDVVKGLVSRLLSALSLNWSLSTKHFKHGKCSLIPSPSVGMRHPPGLQLWVQPALAWNWAPPWRQRWGTLPPTHRPPQSSEGSWSQHDPRERNQSEHKVHTYMYMVSISKHRSIF